MITLSHFLTGILAFFALLPSVALVILLPMLFRRQKQMQKRLDAFENRDTAGLLCAALGGVYDNVLEADLTNDRLQGDNCAKLAALLDLPEGAAYTACIEKILEKMIKPEYRLLYREKFGRENILRRFSEGEEKFSLEFEERFDLVHYHWTRATVRVYHSKVKNSVQIISYIQNIQEEKERELLLEKAAATDYLTELFNRRAAETRIREILAENRAENCHALLVVDIDCFKQVNDALGHAGGDEVLRKVAGLLRERFRESDVVGRFGGDEFLIFMKDCGSGQAALAKARELIRRVSERTDWGISLSLSIGASLFPQQGTDFEGLFQRADAALYYIKTHGRNACLLYRAGLQGSPSCRGALSHPAAVEEPERI